MISDELAKHAPADAVWDMDHPNIAAPWQGNLAPTVSSCADLYTTRDVHEPVLSSSFGPPFGRRAASSVDFVEVDPCRYTNLGCSYPG